MNIKKRLTDNDLKRIQNLCDAATEGPWRAFIEDRDHESGSSFIQTSGNDIEMSGATEADYDFIASAREDVPRLIEELKEMREAIKKAIKTLKNMG
jgi:hypothetical protein